MALVDESSFEPLAIEADEITIGGHDFVAKRVADKRVPPLNEMVRWILGRSCFWCAPYASRLRKKGFDIMTKVADEQAVVLHWMLSMYAEHGDGWFEKAEEFLNAE